jgi:glycosyltransferase involved in cell wall biosynthesis
MKDGARRRGQAYSVAIIGSRGYPYVYSGYETLVRELSERLVKAGIGVTVYCHRNLFPVRPREVNGVRLVYLQTLERKTLSQLLASFQSMVHACLGNHDLILVLNSANGPLGVFPKAFGKKAVINVDGLEWRRPKWKGLGARYFHWASWCATKFYDAVVTDSLEMHKVYEREFGSASTVIAYGASLSGPARTGVLRRWGLTKGDYYLVAGRLVPDNNGDTIIAEFLKTRSTRRLVIVGDVPYRDRYARTLKAVRDPRLLFTGYVHRPGELTELYQNCFAYLHGHEFGGTNPSLLAALGCGCAVCALDTAFNREVLADGRYGLFFTKSAGDLRARVEDMEIRPRRLAPLRNRSRSRIRGSYTWDKVVGQYRDLFEKTLGRRTR